MIVTKKIPLHTIKTVSKVPWSKPREPETPKLKKKPEDNNFQSVLDKEVKNARDI